MVSRFVMPRSTATDGHKEDGDRWANQDLRQPWGYRTESKHLNGIDPELCKRAGVQGRPGLSGGGVPK